MAADQISTSTVVRPAPPRATTTPKEVRQNTNTISTAGANRRATSGRDTDHQTAAGERPAIEALSISERSTCATPLIVARATTPTLNTTCATTISTNRPLRDAGSPPTSARSEVATASVGRTKGATTMTAATRSPGNRRRASTQPTGTPIARHSAVDTTA